MSMLILIGFAGTPPDLPLLLRISKLDEGVFHVL